jgi:hypothetical protein
VRKLYDCPQTEPSLLLAKKRRNMEVQNDWLSYMKRMEIETET